MRDLPVFSLEPSVICCDLCNLESEIGKFAAAGVTALHVDVLDGAFAPSLPVGIDTFKQLAKKTDLPFDIHIMSNNNPWFIGECIKMDPKRICFQMEGEKNPAGMIRMIREAGIHPGLAFSPETPVSSAEEFLPLIDFILLMRIKPGYAGFANESIKIDMDAKIREARKTLDAVKPGMDIVIDGRMTFDDVPRLLGLGATTFVGGSRSLFSSKDYSANFNRMKELYLEAM